MYFNYFSCSLSSFLEGKLHVNGDFCPFCMYYKQQYLKYARQMHDICYMNENKDQQPK